MFEKIRQVFRKYETLEELKAREGFPKPGEFSTLNKQEFRDILERDAPAEVLAEYSSYDDLAPWGTFYLRSENNKCFAVVDYYPMTAEDGTIRQDVEYGVLHKLPYKEAPFPERNTRGQFGISKFVRTN